MANNENFFVNVATICFIILTIIVIFDIIIQLVGKLWT